MKKSIVVLMIIACIALGGVNMFLSTSEDKNAPEIQFQDKEITFIQGEDYTKLLEGVSAKDNRDGDVTQSIVVERIYPNDDGTATIMYAARDKDNNISKANRIVNYQRKDEETDMTPTQIPSSIPDSQDRADSQVEANEEELLAGHPRITLSHEKVDVKVGDSVNRLSYVESITDDKDDQDSLWGSIQISGDEFDPDTAGTYELIYYVIDSEGNKSNEEILTITVQ